MQAEEQRLRKNLEKASKKAKGYGYKSLDEFIDSPRPRKWYNIRDKRDQLREYGRALEKIEAKNDKRSLKEAMAARKAFRPPKSAIPLAGGATIRSKKRVSKSPAKKSVVKKSPAKKSKRK